MKSKSCISSITKNLIICLVSCPSYFLAQSVIFNNTNTGATGTIQTWTEHPCVTCITIEALGAQGGMAMLVRGD